MISMAKIKKIAQSLPTYDYDCVGLRVQDSAFGQNIGDEIVHNSHVWDDGDETADELSGVCAISGSWAQNHSVTAFDSYSGYDGDTILILGSNSYTAGEDTGEIILREAVILDIIQVSGD